ncbi:LacI family DNA-binding transcriptional regulator [Fonticella tunisiensis]|uniref:LacI family transcriptional regulator n=1 Tax=Fonticella tunisiensis TaxID=1096341 RepID=A0A4R7KKS8_9CLOT|nr:LacI family DNA-binding transcriptional regulator [Fonticella tunisiensis]TDT56459.1 LacI family transcriptional regulator [Fonticella tunisiensis]
MAVNISDVAREAGVSISTVSRVLNNNYPVKKETREKIERAIEKLNYKPNIVARSLITRKTSMIGVIVPGITNLFFPTIVETIEEYTKNKGYSISLSDTKGDEVEERNRVEEMLIRQVDGLIVIDPAHENLKKGYYDEISKKIPILIINGLPYGHRCSFVCYDEEAGAREVLQYLFELGHKRIAFVRGDRSLSYDIKEGIYREFIRSKGLEYEKVLNVGMGNSIEVVEKSQMQIEKLLFEEERPTAIFACNDLMAVGVLKACSKLGIKIPENISVVGFDNTLIANIAHPRLTSVDLNIKSIGKIAALELIDIIENRAKMGKKIILNTSLIVRESSSNCII